MIFCRSPPASSSGPRTRCRSCSTSRRGTRAPRSSARTDSYGYEWLIIRDDDFEDLVTTVHLIASELASRGFGEQLLAAAFRFEGGKLPVVWIYGYKRARSGRSTDRGRPGARQRGGVELKAKLEKELPIEPELSRWFGLFDAPL